MLPKKKRSKRTPMELYFENLFIVSDNIKDFMGLMGYDIFDLSDASGVSVRTLKRLLYPVKGKMYNPSLLTLTRVAYGLNVKLEDLFD